jgi:hypothetical protein
MGQPTRPEDIQEVWAIRVKDGMLGRGLYNGHYPAERFHAWPSRESAEAFAEGLRRKVGDVEVVMVSVKPRGHKP